VVKIERGPSDPSLFIYNERVGNLLQSLRSCA